MITKLVYVADDGAEFNSKTACLKHENKNICPQCGGEGVIQEKYNAYPSGLPDSGWVDDWKTRPVDCPTCRGAGHTEKLLKPVTKTVGYE